MVHDEPQQQEENQCQTRAKDTRPSKTIRIFHQIAKGLPHQMVLVRQHRKDQSLDL
jgi:hypothetical protein